jgi:hypothetical protein
MASAELFEDDFIGSLDFFQRLVWIGLFVSCADDQGRVIDNNSVIRSKVFLFDSNVDDVMIETAVKILADAGKIVRYVSGNKRLIQIVKWWQYQTPSWASPSRFPAPNGWTDRAKYHTVGNKIEQLNWDKQGGFDNQMLRSAQGSAIEERRGEERKEEEYERKEEETNVPPDGGNNDFSLSASFVQISGLKTPTSEKELDEWSDTLMRMKKEGVTPSVMRRACSELTEKKYRITSPKSIEKACNMILAEKKRRDNSGYIPISSNSEYSEAVNR